MVFKYNKVKNRNISENVRLLKRKNFEAYLNFSRVSRDTKWDKDGRNFKKGACRSVLKHDHKVAILAQNSLVAVGRRLEVQLTICSRKILTTEGKRERKRDSITYYELIFISR